MLTRPRNIASWFGLMSPIHSEVPSKTSLQEERDGKYMAFMDSTLQPVTTHAA